MKKILSFLIALTLSLSLSSCVATVQAQDDAYDGEVDATVVITYGTPFIVDNMIQYYFYRGWYYYPYWTGNTYYFHRYRRVLPYESFRDWYRPIPRSYHHPRPHQPRHHMDRPHHNHHMTPHNGGNHNRPNVNRPPHNNRGGMGNHRPSSPQRSSTRGGRFGGKR